MPAVTTASRGLLRENRNSSPRGRGNPTRQGVRALAVRPRRRTESPRRLSPDTLALLSAVLDTVAEQRLSAAALARLTRRLAHALGAAALTVRLLDGSRRWLDLKASVGLSRHVRTAVRRVPVASTLGRSVVGHRRSVVRVGNPSGQFAPWPSAMLRRFGAGVIVPIRVGDTVLGSLAVGYRQALRPSASTIRFLEAFGRQLGVAAQIAQVRGTRRKVRSETQFLQRITAAMSANLELRPVLDMVTSAAARLTRARGAVVLLLTRERLELEVASVSRSNSRFNILGLRFPTAQSLSGWVINTGRSVRSHDAVVDRRPMLRELQRTAGVRGLLIVPLPGADGPIGTLAVSSPRPRRFSDHDRHILTQLAHQASIAIQNARLFDAVRGQRQVLRRLYLRQSAMVEDERKRIAHELHDEMGPTLSATLVSLQLLKDRGVGDDTILTKVGETGRLLTGLIEKMRALAYGLRPPMLDQLGLAESLQWMIDTHFAGGGLVVDYRYDAAAVPLHPDVALAIYRIAQEGMTNVVKHAGATRATVRLRVTPSLVTLSIRDDGRGFAVLRSEPDRRHGLGLAGMRERAEQLGGHLEIRSAPGKGCELVVSCPVETPDARAVG